MPIRNAKRAIIAGFNGVSALAINPASASMGHYDNQTAAELAGTYWKENAKLKQALLDQSRAARNGLDPRRYIGSLIQIVGGVRQAVVAAKS